MWFVTTLRVALLHQGIQAYSQVGAQGAADKGWTYSGKCPQNDDSR